MTVIIDSREKLTLALMPETERQEIIQNVYCILQTALGDVPHLRDYGLDNSFLHMPQGTAQSRYAAAIAEAIELYEPRVAVGNIEFENNANDPGKMLPRVEVTFNE